MHSTDTLDGTPETAQPVEAAATAQRLTLADLTLNDRCDADCSGAARAIAHMKAGPLLFCGHHFHKHGPALLVQGAEFEAAEGVNLPVAEKVEKEDAPVGVETPGG